MVNGDICICILQEVRRDGSDGSHAAHVALDFARGSREDWWGRATGGATATTNTTAASAGRGLQAASASWGRLGRLSSCGGRLRWG